MTCGIIYVKHSKQRLVPVLLRKSFVGKMLWDFFLTTKIKKGSSSARNAAGDCVENKMWVMHLYFAKLTNYWDDVWKEIKTILAYELPRTCAVIYLGYLSQGNIQNKYRYLIKILLAASKKPSQGDGIKRTRLLWGNSRHREAYTYYKNIVINIWGKMENLYCL